MWELDHKEGWVLKYWYFQTELLEKPPERPLNCMEIKLDNPKGTQSWIFIGRTEAEAQAPVLWPPDAKSWFTGKDPDAGKDRRQKKKGMVEDRMVGWYHRLNGHEFQQAPEVGEGQGSLGCCGPWGRKESHTTEQLELSWKLVHSRDSLEKEHKRHGEIRKHELNEMGALNME